MQAIDNLSICNYILKLLYILCTDISHVIYIKLIFLVYNNISNYYYFVYNIIYKQV